MGNDQTEANISPSEETPISTAIAEAFGELTETDPTDVGFCLYDYIDPDALNKLFQPDAPEPLTVIFDIERWEVRIRHSDSVCITIEDDPDE